MNGTPEGQNPLPWLWEHFGSASVFVYLTFLWHVECISAWSTEVKVIYCHCCHGKVPQIGTESRWMIEFVGHVICWCIIYNYFCSGSIFKGNKTEISELLVCNPFFSRFFLLLGFSPFFSLLWLLHLFLHFHFEHCNKVVCFLLFFNIDSLRFFVHQILIKSLHIWQDNPSDTCTAYFWIQLVRSIMFLTSFIY